MRRLYTISAITLSLGCAVAVAASAQDSVRVTRRQPRTLVFSGPGGNGGDFVFNTRRGRLGITVDLRPDATHDSVGASVLGVTPGGPADRAGVQTGDIITRLNGVRIVSPEDRTNQDGADDDQSQPGMHLIHLASRLDAGDTVRLDLQRGGRPMTLSFVADRTEMDDMIERSKTLMQRMPFMGEGMGSGMGNGMGHMEMTLDMEPPFGDLELVRVNPQLAEGLGIPEGLLVVSIDSSSTLGLHAGDVITSIGGRHPTSPPQAMRILSTYEPGEAIAFDVMRQHRRTTVNGKLPAQRQGRAWRVRPESFEYFMPEMQDWMQEMPDMGDLPQMRMPFMRGELRRSPDNRIFEMAKPMIRMDGKV